MRRCSLLFVFLLCTTLVFAQNAKTVFLVRHAEKVSEARDALLSDAGKVRAECLAGVLADAGIQTIITSDVRRTQQTAQPLAGRLHEQINTLPAADIGQFVTHIRAAQGNTLVVGHSDTLPNIIQQLTGKSVMIGSNDFDQMFVISMTSNAAGLVTLHVCMKSPDVGVTRLQYSNSHLRTQDSYSLGSAVTFDSSGSVVGEGTSSSTFRNSGNHHDHSATTKSVPTPPNTTAGTVPNQCAVTPDSN